MKKIYLAASVFSIFERALNSKIAKALQEKGQYEVFLPQEISPPETDEGLDMKYIYNQCREHITTSDIVVALVDGSDVDSGVAWELGYAFAKNIPSLCIRTDIRKSEDKGLNIMVEYGATKTVYLTKYHKTTEYVIENMLEELEMIKNGK
jgi:nucleoside 2-deoxyribosyltransferase